MESPFGQLKKSPRQIKGWNEFVFSFIREDSFLKPIINFHPQKIQARKYSFFEKEYYENETISFAPILKTYLLVI